MSTVTAFVLKLIVTVMIAAALSLALRPAQAMSATWRPSASAKPQHVRVIGPAWPRLMRQTRR